MRLPDYFDDSAKIIETNYAYLVDMFSAFAIFLCHECNPSHKHMVEDFLRVVFRSASVSCNKVRLVKSWELNELFLKIVEKKNSKNF